MTNPTINLSPNSTTIASSQLVDTLGCAAKAYYFARLLDQSGSGWATFRLRDAAEWLGCTPGTVRKNLSIAKKKGCFYSVSINRGLAIVRYVSDKRLCRSMGLKLGATFRVSLIELGSLKMWGTYAHVDMMQTVSIQKRKKELKDAKIKHLKVHQPHELLNLALMTPNRYENPGVNSSVNNPQPVGAPIGDSLCAEQVYFRTRRNLFVKSDFQSYGVSQSRVGKSIGRAERTVRRRMANANKIQVAQNTGEGNIDWKVREQFALSEMDVKGTEYCRKRFNAANKTFESKCNIYSLPVELVRQSWKRKALAEMQKKESSVNLGIYTKDKTVKPA